MTREFQMSSMNKGSSMGLISQAVCLAFFVIFIARNFSTVMPSPKKSHYYTHFAHPIPVHIYICHLHAFIPSFHASFSYKVIFCTLYSFLLLEGSLTNYLFKYCLCNKWIHTLIGQWSINWYSMLDNHCWKIIVILICWRQGPWSGRV